MISFGLSELFYLYNVKINHCSFYVQCTWFTYCSEKGLETEVADVTTLYT